MLLQTLGTSAEEASPAQGTPTESIATAWGNMIGQQNTRNEKPAPPRNLSPSPQPPNTQPSPQVSKHSAAPFRPEGRKDPSQEAHPPPLQPPGKVPVRAPQLPQSVLPPAGDGGKAWPGSLSRPQAARSAPAAVPATSSQLGFTSFSCDDLSQTSRDASPPPGPGPVTEQKSHPSRPAISQGHGQTGDATVHVTILPRQPVVSPGPEAKNR